MSTYANVNFLTSAATAGQFVADTGREVAFAGRSNAGKSTAINAVTGRSRLARVSRTPGRTQLINFFEVGPDRRLVDLPGYGFAKVPHAVRDRWHALMRVYFERRESLVGLVLIVDARRGLGDLDRAMLDWALGRDRRAHVLLSKADKLGRQESVRVLRATEAECAGTGIGVQLFSAHERQGIDAAQDVLAQWLEGDREPT
jgi:GTP-binding protein